MTELGYVQLGELSVSLMSNGEWVSDNWHLAAMLLNASGIGGPADTVDPQYIPNEIRRAKQMLKADSYKVNETPTPAVPVDAVY